MNYTENPSAASATKRGIKRPRGGNKKGRRVVSVVLALNATRCCSSAWTYENRVFELDDD